MIISHKYKFIFIKTKKTAGTSIEVFLSALCGEEDSVTPINPHVEPHYARNYQGFWNPFPEVVGNVGISIDTTVRDFVQRRKLFNHIKASVVRNRISKKIWNSYFKFCVERNPWDKTLSHYYMVNYRTGRDISFDEYLKEGRFCMNYPSYCDFSGRVLVDKVIRYESLMDELGHVFKELGIPFDGTLGVKAKSEHRKDHRPYQEAYSVEQREVIEKAFAKEIEMHGYVY